MGYKRSHSVTEKHIAMKGTSPSKSETRDGLFTGTDLASISPERALNYVKGKGH